MVFTFMESGRLVGMRVDPAAKTVAAGNFWMKTPRVVPLADERDIEIEHKTSHRLVVERPDSMKVKTTSATSPAPSARPGRQSKLIDQ